MAMSQPQELNRCPQRGQGDQRGHLGPWGRVQLHDCRGDDAQRAFRADEKVAQVVAGVVFAQTGQAVPNLALRCHHFQAQAQVARIAKTHHLRTTRVGAQIAANGATALRGQAERKQQPGRFAHGLQVLQHAACIHGNRQVIGVELAHRVHPAQADHHLLARGVGRGADHHAGIAALGHHAHSRCDAGFDDGRHLLCRTRAHHRQGFAALAATPVQLIGAEVAVYQHMGWPQQGAQCLQECAMRHCGHS